MLGFKKSLEDLKQETQWGLCYSDLRLACSYIPTALHTHNPRPRSHRWPECTPHLSLVPFLTLLPCSLSQKWVGTPFPPSSLELGPWSPGVLSTLEMYNCCPPPNAAKGLELTVLSGPADVVESDGVPEPGSWGPAPSTTGSLGSLAFSQEPERPYGLVSIDTVMVVGVEGPCAWPCTCEDDGYPTLNLDTSLEPGPGTEDPLLGTGATVLSCGCVTAGEPAGLGEPLGSLLDRLRLPLEGEAGWAPGPPWGGRPPRGASDSEAGSPPAGLDMDTFDSGFAGSDCGSPVECDFISPRDEGPPRSYLRQWVVMAPPPAGSGPQASS